jgi:hypothetical protein
MILGRERIDASIDADVANKEIRTLDKVRYLINVSSAETTCGSCHRRAPSLPSQRDLRFGLADKHGLRLHSTDEAMGDHARRWLPEDCPNLTEFVKTSMDLRRIDRSPQTVLETFHWCRGKGFGLIIEDLLALPLDQGVIA